jgi:uncharacterized membrane protein (DUF4010 family)
MEAILVVDRKTQRWWIVRIIPTMLVYFVFVMCIAPFSRVLGDSPWRYMIAALPALPIAVVVYFYIVLLRRMDEMQRQIQLEALAFSVGVTGLITFALGLMEAAGLGPIGLIWVFPMLIMFWGFGTILARRRYE